MAILKEVLFILLAATAMMTAALTAAWLMRSRSATQRWQVLAAAVVLSLTLPLFTGLLPAPMASAPMTSTTKQLASRPEKETADVAASTPERPLTVTSESIIYPPIASTPFEGWILLGLGVWIFGVVSGTIRLARSHRRARQLVTTARRVTAGPLLAETRHLAAELGVLRPVDILQSDTADTPLTVGWWRPRILLPDGAESWPATRLRTVLGHEMAHIARHDALVNLAGSLVAILHWFNPLAWALLARLRYEAEKASDDTVLRLGVRPSAYAKVLLEQAAPAPATAPAPRLATVAPFACQAEQRLQAVLDPGVDHRGSRRRAAFGFTLALLLVIMPLTALRPAALAVGDDPTAAELSDGKVTIRIADTGSGPDWWREMTSEIREMQAVKRWLKDPSLGTPLPEGASTNVGGEWTVEAHDAVALDGCKYGCVFTSDEAFIRISRDTPDGSFEFGVYAFPHPPLEGAELFFERMLNGIGLGFSDNLRAYRIPHGYNKTTLAQLRAVVAAYAAGLKTPTETASRED